MDCVKAATTREAENGRRVMVVVLATEVGRIRGLKHPLACG